MKNQTETTQEKIDKAAIANIDWRISYHQDKIDQLNEQRRELINRMGTNKK